MVQEGKVPREQKIGNDKADEAAKRGMVEHSNELVKVAGWYTGRHIQYTKFIWDIHTHIIEGCKIRRDILCEREEEAKKQGNFIEKEKGKVVTYTHYHMKGPTIDNEHRWRRMQIHEPGSKGSKEEYGVKLKEAMKFLTKLAVRKPSADQFGITWLELFVLYRALGHPNPVDDHIKATATRPSMGVQLAEFKKLVRRAAKDGIDDEETKKFFTPGQKRDMPCRGWA